MSEHTHTNPESVTTTSGRVVTMTAEVRRTLFVGFHNVLCRPNEYGTLANGRYLPRRDLRPDFYGPGCECPDHPVRYLGHTFVPSPDEVRSVNEFLDGNR